MIDSINTLARAHELTLHTRSTSYTHESVWALLEQKKIFEGYAHARSLIPIEEFPYHYAKMIRRRKEKSSLDKETVTKILGQIYDLGEITTKQVDLSFLPPQPKSRWSSLAKRILEHLERRGHIMVHRREGFSTIIYAPTEANIKIPDHLPDSLETFNHTIMRNLRILGLTPFHRLLRYTYSAGNFVHEGKRMNPRTFIQKSIRNGDIAEITIEDTQYLYHPEHPPQPIETSASTVFLLNPFDNALWSRESILEQYGFDYKMEIYVPKNKRIYGFYTLPILYGTEFAGRVDASYDRNEQRLKLIAWHWESQFAPDPEFWNGLAQTIERLKNFLGAHNVDYGNLAQKYAKLLSKQFSSSL